MKIQEGRTKEQALEVFERHCANQRYTESVEISEVFGAALKWKMANVPKDQWRDYPIKQVCITILAGDEI